MARSSLPALVVSLLALAIGGVRGGPRQPSPESVEPLRVTAEELWQHPARHQGRTVALDAQFHSELRSWNPMLSRFGGGEYRAFRFWSEDQFPWVVGDYRAPLVTVYARSEGAAAWALEDIGRYARFELACEVRSSFAGRPWLEVVAVKPRLRSLTEGVVLHAARGVEQMDRGAWGAALEELRRADRGGVPPAAEAELERLIAECEEHLARRVVPGAGDPGAR
jgi:hypothetical protein